MNKNLKNLFFIPFNLLYAVNPALTTRMIYFAKHRKKLNLKQPKNYNEKLNWLKLYDRNPLLPLCADKFGVRSYIEEKGYGEHLPELYWHGDNVDDIPCESLPDSFVIKISNGCGYNIFCRNKQDFDWADAKRKLRGWLSKKYIPCYGEWMYAESKSTIMIEELLSDGEHIVPVDYKFFTFNGIEGKIGAISVDTGRFIEHRRSFYDADWNLLDVRVSFDHIDEAVEKPVCYDAMCAAARKLAEPFVHVRVDFYVIGDKFYIGEMTFFNGAGFGRITPESFSLKMGSWMKLPIEQ